MTPEELASLIDRHLEGRTSGEEAEALSRQLECHAAARRRYLRAAQLHANLAAEESPEAVEPHAAAAPARPAPGPWLAWVAGCSGLAAAGLLAWRTLLAPPSLEAAPPVATVERLEDARWVAPEVRWQPGDPLRAGQTLELSAGLARVAFANGARVTLIGPSIFEVSSADSGFLTLGQLKAEADAPGAKGFTVRTRTARAVDVGTTFVAAAAADGQSRFDVTDGEVQVHLAGAPAPQVLRTGEALAVGAGTSPVLVRSEPGDGTAAFRFPTIEPPSAGDWADASRGQASIRVVRGALRTQVPLPSGPPALLLDGRGQSRPDSPGESVFFDDNAPGTLLIDLGQPVLLTRINTYSWHQNRDAEVRVRAVQKFTLYGYLGDAAPDQGGTLTERDWELLARVDSDDFLRVTQAAARPAQ
ncbi:MAG: FecR domain-containing protein, partial [Verrucomicrobiota bacterium]